MRAALLALALAACSSDSGGTTADAPSGTDGYPTERCLIVGNYGDLGTKVGSTTPGGPTSATIVLDPGPPRDSFFLKLVSGKGAFAGGLANGTFSITGADAQYSNCGLCVNLIADISPMTGPAKFYFASSGSVTLTATQPPAGSLSDAHFVEVDISTGQPVSGGCEGSIASLSFSSS